MNQAGEGTPDAALFASALRQALAGPAPWEFLQALRDAGRLGQMLPEVDALWGVPQPAAHHPEIDTGLHCMMVLRQACTLSADPAVRFAALVHDLGKAATPVADWPRHIGHEQGGLPIIAALAERLGLPADWADLGMAACRWHIMVHQAASLRPATLHDLLAALSDEWRQPQRLEKLLLVFEADARGRLSHEERPYPQAALLHRCYQAAMSVPASARQRELRIARIRAMLDGEQA